MTSKRTRDELEPLAGGQAPILWSSPPGTVHVRPACIHDTRDLHAVDAWEFQQNVNNGLAIEAELSLVDACARLPPRARLGCKHKPSMLPSSSIVNGLPFMNDCVKQQHRPTALGTRVRELYSTGSETAQCFEPSPPSDATPPERPAAES